MRRVAVFGVLVGLLLTPPPFSAAARQAPGTSAVTFEHSGAVHTVRLPASDALEPAVARALEDTRARIASIDMATAPGQGASTLGHAALLLLAHEFWQAADDALAAAEALSPDDFRWSYYRAWAASRAGDLALALDFYEQSLVLRSDHLPTLVRAGRAAVEAGQLERGAELLRRALEVAPGQPAALATLGQLALEEGRAEEAIDLLEQALAAAPDANALYFPLAMAYRSQGDLDRARAAMSRRGTVGIDVPDPLLDRLEGASAGATAAGLRGRAAFAAGRYLEAAAEFERALAADPDRVDIRVNLGAALGESGQIDRAIEEYEELLRREPDHPIGHLNLSQLLLKRGTPSDWDRLATLGTRASELLPQDLEAQHLAARVASQKGDTQGALAAYRRCLAIDPRDEACYYEAAILLIGAQRYREAVSVLDTGLAELPDQGRLLHLMARLMAAAPDPALRDGARALGYAQAVARQEPQPDHLRTLAMAYAEVGACDDAARVIERLLEQLTPETPPDLVELRDRFRAQRPCRMPLE